MAGHGGARSGAGRPAGGISQARRIMADGIQRALAYDPDGNMTEDQQLEEATRTVADIAGAMISAGRGDQVLALYAASAPKDSKGDAPKSALLEALNKLNSGASAPKLSHSGAIEGEIVEETEGYEKSATDTKPEARQNQAKMPGQLPLIDGHPAAGRGGRLTPPAPPYAPAPTPMGLDGENFEKISEGGCQ